MSMSESDYEEPTVYIPLMHSTTVISVFVTTLAGYCIIYKSTEIMKSYSRVLLNHLFWAFLLELMLNSGATPVIYSPYNAMSPAGFLNLFGISSHVQISMIVATLGFVSVTFVQIYIHRYITLKRRQKYDRNAYFVAISLFYFVVILLTIVSYNLLKPDPELSRSIAKTTYKYKLPLDDDNLIIYAFSNNTWRGVHGKLMLSIMLIESLTVIAMAGLSFYELRMQYSSISAQTAKQQMTYLVAVCVQTLVAFLVLVIPMIIVSWSIILAFRADDLVHASVYFVSLNGTMDTICLLTVNKPYRMAVKKIFGIEYNKKCAIFCIQFHNTQYTIENEDQHSQHTEVAPKDVITE